MDPSLRVGIFDRHEKPRWHPIWIGNPVIAPPAAIQSGEPVHIVRNGPDLRPYFHPPFTKHGGWKFNKSFKASEHIAQIYLTHEEASLGAALRRQIGPYVLIEPWSKHENLRWPLRHWEALVASRKDVTFVQHVQKETGAFLVPGAQQAPVANFREACGLVRTALVYIRGESGMLHAAAALRVPAIAIWGGCMDWEVLGNYPTHVGVGISDPVCGSWLPCPHCEELMAGISVEEVRTALGEFA